MHKKIDPLNESEDYNEETKKYWKRILGKDFYILPVDKKIKKLEWYKKFCLIFGIIFNALVLGLVVFLFVIGQFAYAIGFAFNILLSIYFGVIVAIQNANNKIKQIKSQAKEEVFHNETDQREE